MQRKALLQFGVSEPAVRYRDRPTVFGVAERQGRLALVRVTREGQAPYYDLPGGALDTGESDARALAREFAEEVGLVVHAGRILASAGQYAQTSEGEAVNNRCTLMEAVIDRFDRTLKVEDTHELVWVEPLEALRVVRRESHAWAIACWIRRAAPAGVDV